MSELQLGAYLFSNGFVGEYDRKIGSKTPDWCILDEFQSVKCIVELTYHHLNQKTEGKVESKRRTGRAVVGYRPDENDPKHNRLYTDLQDKATIYRELIEKMKVPFVIAVFCDVYAAVNLEDLKICLFGDESAIFTLYPHFSFR